MNFIATKARVFNRGVPPDAFLAELVAWGKAAPDEIFAPNNRADIYNKIKPELGPWNGFQHRKAAMLEVMRVLAGFESSWRWKEGVDTSKAGQNTPSNAEAGAWQTSYDARDKAPGLMEMLAKAGVSDGVEFQQKMKADHPFAMEFVARLMRKNVKHNGPLYKGFDARKAVWPDRPKLWSEEESIYPWLSRASVQEFQKLLA